MSDSDTKSEALSELERFRLCKDLFFQEQAYYWQRFSGIAALQAGLIVLSISATTNVLTELIDLFGITLGVLWVYILTVSLWYVNRYKPAFHELRESLGITFDSPNILSNPRYSSTDAARLVAILITSLWAVKFFFDMSVRIFA